MAIEVTFDRSLYLPEAVEAAVAAYEGYARVILKETPEATLAAIDVDAGGSIAVDTLVHSFCNHVLYETVGRARRGRG